MIIFDLICSESHIFEGWFSSSDDYQTQVDKGLLSCPHCGSYDISKSVMSPNIGMKSNQKIYEKPAISAGSADEQIHKSHEIANDVENAPLANIDTQLNDNMHKKMVEAIAKVQKEVLKDSTWVGNKFAQEARAIHYGEADKRLIHGHASQDEVSELSEEGINIAALPMPYIPPDMKN